MLDMEDVESGARVVHKNTGLQYSVVDVGDDEALLSPESQGLQDLVVPVRPAGTEDWSEDRLAAIVTRDCLIGTALPVVA